MHRTLLGLSARWRWKALLFALLMTAAVVTGLQSETTGDFGLPNRVWAALGVPVCVLVWVEVVPALVKPRLYDLELDAEGVTFADTVWRGLVPSVRRKKVLWRDVGRIAHGDRIFVLYPTEPPPPQAKRAPERFYRRRTLKEIHAAPPTLGAIWDGYDTPGTTLAALLDRYQAQART